MAKTFCEGRIFLEARACGIRVALWGGAAIAPDHCRRKPTIGENGWL